MNNYPSSRRDFLKQTALTSAAFTLPGIVSAGKEAVPKMPSGSIILFQGDSITDGGRGRNNDWNHVLGQDYAYLIASRTWLDHPDKEYMFYNRGISGNKVPDLLARWQSDTLDLKPDLLSILIGVNDTSAALNGNSDYTPQSYEAGYRRLLDTTKKALPAVKLVICESFLLPVGKIKDNWEKYQAEIRPRQGIARKLAGEFDAAFVPFQDHFNAALKKGPAERWIWDGIHPMPAGHELMAREWLRTVNKKYKLA